MTESIQLAYDENITLQKFWDLANDLLYTKVYYDEATNEYFTKCIKKIKSRSLLKSDSDIDTDTDGGGITTDDDIEDEDLDQCTEDEINTLLVSYLTLISNYCDKLAAGQNEERFYQKAANFIVKYNRYQVNLEFCVRKMLSLLNYIIQSNSCNLGIDMNTIDADLKEQINQTIEANEKLIRIIGWILFVNYQDKKEQIFAILREFQGFETIAGVLSNYAKISKNSSEGDDPYISNYSNYLQLFYDLCTSYEFDANELDSIESEFVEYLFKKLAISTRDQDTSNFLRFKALLILNEQFMVCNYAESGEKVINKFFVTMVEDNSIFQNFTETLILNFNREQDHVIQILMLKVLYLIFTTSSTCQWLYLNDLKVIVDIMIRELFNLSIVKEESLINTYLRVLYPMLLFSNLKTERYKSESLLDLLNYLYNAEQNSATMKRLAERCFTLDILKKPAEIPEPTSNAQPIDIGRMPSSLKHTSSQSSVISELETPTGSPGPTHPMLNYITSNSSSSTVDSTSNRRQRRPPPPPPPPSRRIGPHSTSELSLSRAKTQNSF